ncbi:MAG: hypothetical protein WBM13_01870 [Bacteroidia bacterium]
MYRKLFNLMVLMITVLVVNLLTDYITTWLINYKVDINPFKYTAIVMLMLVFVLVPAYSYLADKIELLVARLLVKGSNSFGKIIGLLFSFALIFSILYAIYLHQLFHINLLKYLMDIIFNTKSSIN